MKWLVTVLLICTPLAATAADRGAPLGSSSGGSLYNPSINVIGKTASTRVTTIKPRGELTVSGPLSAAPSRRTSGDSLLIERRLDCFEDSSPPGRDGRNRFLTRCPGNL